MTIRPSLFAALCTALTLSASPARAQDAATGFDIQLFRAAPAQNTSFFALRGAQVAGHLEWEAALALGHAARLLIERDADDAVLNKPLTGLLTLDVLGSIGLFDRVDVGLAVPVVLVQAGDDPAEGSTQFGFDRGAGLGDVRVDPRVAIVSVGPLHVGGVAGISLPTGSRDGLRGGGFQLRPALLLEVASDSGTGIALNAGYVLRDQSYIRPQGLEMDDAITWGVGARVTAMEELALLAEVRGEIGYASVTDKGPSSAEAMIGGRLAIGTGLFTTIGVGTGLGGGVGVPAARVMALIGYAKTHSVDRDGDGMNNGVDGCPDAAEDLDGFEDDDGCPDDDNDQDGVTDRRDRCPTVPEDPDDFEDDDGCPDDDNDQDGITDALDGCPGEAEDIDLFADDDGCPEADNDADGVLDADDECPAEAEDVDAFEDTDGCPEVDNDGDGVLDADDACPGDAETVNGVDDADGCSEPGSRLHIDRRRHELVVLEECGLDAARDVVAASGLTCASQLAVALAAYPDYRVRVVVRSRDRSSDEANLRASEARAAAFRAALEAEGLGPDRVETSAYALAADAAAAPVELELRLLR